MANFAIVGVAGYIAPRHLTAIAATGNTVVAAFDPFDSVGRLDASFPNCQFFTDQDSFKAYIDRVKGTPDQVDWLSICTPNYTHAQYIRYGLTHGMNVICEKPVVLHAEEIQDIMELEKSTGHQVYTILQLRLHDSIAQLKKRLEESSDDRIHNIDLTYITSRGNWYYTSWKGDIQKSGGIATNIGVHLFDMVQWLFGPVKENVVRVLEEDRVEGQLKLQHAIVNYFLSINSAYLPDNAVKGEKKTYRTLNIDGDEFEFSKGFTELHTLSYQKILAGEGFRISETIDSIRLVEQLRPEIEKPTQMVDLKGQYYRLQEEIDSAIRKVLNSSAFIGGPIVRSFEDHLSAYIDGCNVISCASGTDALQIGLMSFDLNPGDEVIVPAFNYVAAAEAVALLGLKPVFVDVIPETFNMDPEALKSAITTKTKAIIPVHLFGQSCDMAPILALAKQNNLYVIEDNAQAIGAEYIFHDGHREKTGTMGTIGCTSFFPSKNLGCYGDGGAIFCKDHELAKKIRMIANHGQSQKYHHAVVGCNSRLDAIQAAVLDVKLRCLNDFNDARRKAAAYYTAELKSFDPEGRYYHTPEETEYSTHVYHQYTLRIKNGLRDALKQYLERQGIPSMVYYPLPLQKQPAYSDICSSADNLPNATSLCSEVLSIPMHTELTYQIQDKVISAFKFFFRDNHD